MKKILLLIFIFPLLTNAQGKNVIKTNLSGLLINNYNITYERSILKKMSLSVGFRYMPKTTVPLKSTLEKYLDNPDIKINDFEMGNMAITPELRLYLSAGKLKGFYIAPYVRYASFDLTVPVTYDRPGFTTKPTVLFNGKITSLSAGLLLGMQYNIAKKLVLDFWLIGAHYGTSNGNIDATNINPALNSQADRDALQSQLNEFNEFGPFKFESKVTSATTANIKSVGAWAGVRALGLSLGVRF